MLTKPTQQVAHGGGLRFEASSDYYKTIFNWIAQGVPFGDPAKNAVRRLEVEPKEILMNAPGESAVVKVSAILPMAATGCQREAVLSINVPDLATVGDDGQGARTANALLVRYQGNFTTLPVTVLNPKPGFTWKRFNITTISTV